MTRHTEEGPPEGSTLQKMFAEDAEAKAVWDAMIAYAKIARTLPRQTDEEQMSEVYLSQDKA